MRCLAANLESNKSSLEKRMKLKGFSQISSNQKPRKNCVWSVNSAIFFLYVQMEHTKQNVVVLILISSLLPFN